jgi:hypothetical protein
MKRILIALPISALLLIPTIGARAQGPTATPTPTPTNTPTATATFTPSATLDIWDMATVGPESDPQLVALEYSFTAGDALQATALLIGIGLLSMLVFLALRKE